MDHFLCIRFNTLRRYYPDELNISTNYDFHSNGSISDYCPNGDSGSKQECKTELDKINAACIWLFNQIISNKINSLNKEQVKIIVTYIMIWLSYKLNKNPDVGITTLNEFYTKYIKNHTDSTNCKKSDIDCSNTLKDKTGYKNFKEFIEGNEYFTNMDMNIMSNFYDAFKLLCTMHTEFNENEPDCNNYLEKAREFVKKYEKLNGNYNNNEYSSYIQILSTLSNDYKNFKNKCENIKCNDIPSLPEIAKKNYEQRSEVTSSSSSIEKKISEQRYEQDSDVTLSSSSITNKLIPVLSIIVAIPIFLGIFYKYSLFGFRKRTQKQHIREKLKK
ncbi:PIR protein [Plasmodium yoelii]|uniref:PIR protein n=2 Tax=Plasmodium yoelii TaxID=5861 RepID=A0AAE9WW27_PLAYO|nr:PIR protein [Plasmodium yoelii]WBY61346.1 PIR protein [Plasmodium yoelii yoelii]CDS44671.1 YIR protein [Plasmodium yoelii]VTZ82000.1 PIR protein [Plasmodium yoelii]|eukprot:XP_022813092.1 PIR protein [Plasmodium yoelii]